METLQKTVVIGCLIYGLYGLVSVLELGHFIPPLPLKPFLFIAFLFAFTVDDYKSLRRPLHSTLFVWLGALALTGQFFVETLFSYETTLYYLKHIESIVFIASMVSFALFVFFILKEIKPSLLLYFFFLIGFVFLFVFSFSSLSYFIYNWTIVLASLFFYLFTRLKAEKRKEELEKPLLILYGVSVVKFMEQMVYAFS